MYVKVNSTFYQFYFNFWPNYIAGLSVIITHFTSKAMKTDMSTAKAWSDGIFSVFFYFCSSVLYYILHNYIGLLYVKN